jgi:uncharacterized protein
MAGNVLVDAGFVVALLSRGDTHPRWAVAQLPQHSPPWATCEAALSEAFHLLGSRGSPSLRALLVRGAVVIDFDLAKELPAVLRLMQKYANMPMSLADACLVRMTEARAKSILLTTDSDFGVYRRNGRQVISCATPR